METILYFYTMDKRAPYGELPIQLERISRQNYCLVRAGIQRSYLKELDAEYHRALSREEEYRLLSQKKNLRERLFGKRQRRQKEREYIEHLNCLHDRVGDLAELVCPLVDFPNECSYVYEDGLDIHVFAKLWQQHCDFIELRAEDYVKSPWVEELLSQAQYNHYMILGCVQALIRPLWQRASHIKSLQWFLTKRQYTKELQEFIEELSMEYGLIADVQLLEGEEEYHKRRLKSALPVNVLDFTEVTGLKLSELAGGSCYLDMCSLKEKRRLIEERGLPIRYFSMKKQWKEWQNSIAALDTTHKNGYNTLVNQGYFENSQAEGSNVDDK
ncbi:MAG: hypothetical protein NC081_04860 [Roseburia sp.]|nr:hypothetical protein [Roseburia sp.]